jgi:hypothetical protein
VLRAVGWLLFALSLMSILIRKWNTLVASEVERENKQVEVHDRSWHLADEVVIRLFALSLMSILIRLISVKKMDNSSRARSSEKISN